MKRIFAIVMLLCLLLASCGGNGTVELKYKDGCFIGGGVTYVSVTGVYEPKAIGEAYAVYPNAGATFYEIPGYDPKQWLTEENLGGLTSVLVADTVTLPTWETLVADELLICQSEEITIALQVIHETDTIEAIRAAFVNGENTEWPNTTASVRYELKFSSSDLPIYMNLVYAEFTEGTFIYDRSAKRCVEIGNLLNDFLTAETDGAS